MITRISVFAIALFGMFNAGCMGCTQIDPGHVGVMIKKCGNGGVDEKPLGVGYQWRKLFCEEIAEYPIFQQTVVFTKNPHEGNNSTAETDQSITVNSSEGLPIVVDCSLSFTLEPSKVPSIYKKFRQDIHTIEQIYVRQVVREGMQESFAKYPAEQAYASKKTELRNVIEVFIKERLGRDGFNVTNFTLNEVRVPAQVAEAINQKVKMTQDAMRSEAEVRKIEAEAKQRVAKANGEAAAMEIMAKAEADRNKILASSITPQLLETQRIQAQVRAIDKWSGTMPTMTGSAIPFIQMPSK